MSLQPNFAEFARTTQKVEQACCTDHELQSRIALQCTYEDEYTVFGKLAESTFCQAPCDGAFLLY
jgi:hypothetical protein